MSVDVIDAFAHQIVTDHLATRFKSDAAWTKPGYGDIPQADADAIADRANTLMSAVADAFAKSGDQR